MQAKDIMTTDVYYLKADTPIHDAVKLFVEKNISGAPVVDAEHKVIGVLSEGDLVFQNKTLRQPTYLNLFGGFIQLDRKEYEEELHKVAAATVGELMTKDVVYARENASIEELSQMMIEENVNRIPIVDVQLKLVGIVSRHDIVKSMM